MEEKVNYSAERQGNIPKIIEAIRNNPKATNKELSEMTGIGESSIRPCLHRMKSRGLIEDVGVNQREFAILRELDDTRSTYKRDIFEMMVDKYLEDFEAAEMFGERVEIGKMIIRLLEKL